FYGSRKRIMRHIFHIERKKLKNRSNHLKFRCRVNLVKALLTRKIKIKGPAKLMMAFAKCFPS
ncbi:MAG: hypothetical protein V3V39_13590, partial [Desulfobacterales bacterium]